MLTLLTPRALHVCTADHPLPRPLQVVIFALSTPTRTSEYLLAQIFTLFRMVYFVFAANVVEKNACARTVAGCVVAVRGGSVPGGVF